MKLLLISLVLTIGLANCTPTPQPTSFDLLNERALKQFLLKQKSPNIKVVGGQDAAPGEAPFQMQLYRKTLFNQYFMCGGSLISPKTILSAGHCVSYFLDYRIRYGSNNRFDSPYPDERIDAIKLHPEFDMDTVQNDLALFILKNPIKPSVNVRTITLQQDNVNDNTNVTLYGFGLTDGFANEPSVMLQTTTLKTLPEQDCKNFVESLGVVKNDGMICAQAPETSGCNGDSGGPLLVTEQKTQLGIVSFGTRYCPPGSINVYTNIPHYYDWIMKHLE